jgi:glycosyltransferase involved in cell wall biosynthesis
VTSAEIPAVLTELDALLSPSRWFENGPTIALEAIAVGTPIIATRVGNLAEIVEDGVSGRLVEAGNVGELSAAILEAATDPHKTIDVWRRGLRPVRSMDDIARDYMTMYAA